MHSNMQTAGNGTAGYCPRYLGQPIQEARSINSSTELYSVRGLFILLREELRHILQHVVEFV